MTGAQRNPQDDANASNRSAEQVETPKRSKDDERAARMASTGFFSAFPQPADSRMTAAMIESSALSMIPRICFFTFRYLRKKNKFISVVLL